MTRASDKYRYLKIALSVLLWIALWELAAFVIDKTYIFPGAIETVKTLSALIFTSKFWISVSLSVLRILLGLVLGIAIGLLLATLTVRFRIISSFLSVAMTVVRCTPIAAVIMLLWAIIGSRSLPVAIAVLMVAPIIWQNVTDGYNDIDKRLDEVALIFGFSPMKRLRLIVIPTVMRYLLPAVLTSVGLAWKSGISAEIIAYTKNSVGKEIYNAKYYLEGAELMSWTVTVILISLAFELIVKMLARRVKVYEPHA